MIPRTLEIKLLELAKQFPAIAVLGPRQSGKTTLVKTLFPHYKYVNLESFEEREFSEFDSKGFLARFQDSQGVIFDEIQKSPKLISYLQIEIDKNPHLGKFILTGSQNILLNQHISQTLAGRIALTTLLPFSIEELQNANKLPPTATEALFKGFYPRVHNHSLDPVIFYESYSRTYLERDVRDIKNIASLSDFQRFMKLCAGRIGQLLNLSSLATEAGLSLPTVKSWLSILEASYVIFLLQPYHVNFNKRLVKMPKLYFYDSALACSLLNITNPSDVYNYYQRGSLFESMVVSNFLKNRYHRGLPPNLYFWRDKLGNEIDLIIENGSCIEAVEIKSSETINSNLFDGLIKWAHITGNKENSTLVYAGSENQIRTPGNVLSWSCL